MLIVESGGESDLDSRTTGTSTIITGVGPPRILQYKAETKSAPINYGEIEVSDFNCIIFLCLWWCCNLLTVPENIPKRSKMGGSKLWGAKKLWWTPWRNGFAPKTTRRVKQWYKQNWHWASCSLWYTAGKCVQLSDYPVHLSLNLLIARKRKWRKNKQQKDWGHMKRRDRNKL